MGRRLLSKAFRVNSAGEMLVNFSADRESGAQVGKSEFPPKNCTPFSDEGPLVDRKYLILSFPLDGVYFGSNSVLLTNSYFSPGTNRGDFGTHPPRTSNYSNRKQFIRGQYFQFASLPVIEICANSVAIENATSLELS